MPDLIDLMESAYAARDAAVATVEANAEEQSPGFVDRAAAFVLERLASGPESGEELTLACKRAGIVPHDDRAFGPVYMRLSRRKLIVKAGSVPRMRGHGAAGGNVWKLAEDAR